LSMEICLGKNLLISGGSSTGKTSLLRAIAGLWECTSGTIDWHSDVSDLIFVPQNPYFPSGGTTLRQQLLYPSTAEKGEAETQRITDLLTSLQMNKTLIRFSGLDETVEGDWSTLGED
uniref:ABC transporter domain-containing protein n=1 Tax=Gongylonema pulchrum TaxID=637853 RepID=A0A183D4H0_9BILA